MQRAWLPLALILVVCVGVLLWPASNLVADNSDPSAAAPEREEERGLAEVGSLSELDQFPVNPLELVPEDREVKPVREGGGVLPTEVGSDVDLATVRVRVINEGGSPLEGASVGVMGIVSVDAEGDLRSLKPIFFAVQGAPVEAEGVQVNEVMSDGEGLVELSAPEGVQIVVYARLARHLISFKLSGDLEAGETRDLGDLRLAPGGHLEVRVLDEYGVAIEDAAVFMALANGGDFEEEVSLHFLETEKDGIVVFQHLSFNDYKLDVAKHGFQHYHQNPVSITQRGDGLVEVMLSRGDAMAGTVVDSFGAPVEGVTVTARARERKHRLEGMAEGLLGPVPPVITGTEGSFRMEGMFEDAEYNLVADPERGLSARRREKPSEQLRIVLPETAFVIGRVINSEGEPVPEGRVGFRPESGRWPRPTWKRTGLDGRFEVELSPGRYSYSISHAFGERYSLDPQEFRGEIDLGDLQLEPGGRAEFSFLSPQGEATDGVRFRSLNRVDGAAESEPR
ncbi:MAG: carboxypeptidase-like regulatory domain-containing protein, partial [Planctomycetes bacterium]|nr:carboxypeptidase-like regulatory domain-containing protein [Planctomycetota bacterium]